MISGRLAWFTTDAQNTHGTPRTKVRIGHVSAGLRGRDLSLALHHVEGRGDKNTYVYIYIADQG